MRRLVDERPGARRARELPRVPVNGDTARVTLESDPIATPAVAGPPAARARLSGGTITWIVIGVAVFLLLSAAILAAHAIANLRFDAAVSSHQVAVMDAKAVDSYTEAASEDAAATSEIAAALLAAPDALVDVNAKAALSTSATELGATIEAAPAFEVDAPDATGPRPRPIWFGDLVGATDALTAETTRLNDGADALDAHVERLAVADQVTADAGIAFVDAIAPVAASIEAANGSARNVERIEYRNAVEQLSGTTWGFDAPARVDEYVATATALQSTHAAEEAEKAGPLYERRVAVEAFARSIAGGVLLEFDWAPIVIGYGDNGSAGGTATWDTWEGGLSTITLSNSVAEEWGDPIMAALVTHEVGHAITSKCYDIVGEYADDNEPWATAWAIGQGHTDPNGNGEWLYGRPSDELIERSKTCR